MDRALAVAPAHPSDAFGDDDGDTVFDSYDPSTVGQHPPYPGLVWNPTIHRYVHPVTGEVYRPPGRKVRKEQPRPGEKPALPDEPPRSEPAPDLPAEAQATLWKRLPRLNQQAMGRVVQVAKSSYRSVTVKTTEFCVAHPDLAEKLPEVCDRAIASGALVELCHHVFESGGAAGINVNPNEFVGMAHVVSVALAYGVRAGVAAARTAGRAISRRVRFADDDAILTAGLADLLAGALSPIVGRPVAATEPEVMDFARRAVSGSAGGLSEWFDESSSAGQHPPHPGLVYDRSDHHYHRPDRDQPSATVTDPARGEDVLTRGAFDQLLAKIRSDGGFTFDPLSGGYPQQGYAVSIHKGREAVLKKEMIEKGFSADVADFYAKNADLLRQPGNMIGGWVDDTGKVYLDVTHVEPDRAKALALGRQHDQEGVFDLGSFQTVWLKPGPGRVVAEHSAASAAISDSAGDITGTGRRADPTGRDPSRGRDDYPRGATAGPIVTGGTVGDPAVGVGGAGPAGVSFLGEYDFAGSLLGPG